MRCPFCHVDEDKVVDSRVSEGGRVIRRRRECRECGKRFSTVEKIEASVSLMVIKRGGARIPYRRDKMLAGVRKACYKREVSDDTIERLGDSIEEELLKRGVEEVSSVDIGLSVCEHLKQLDHVAFLRFASIYLNPDKVDDLLDQVREVQENLKHNQPGQRTLF